MPRPRSHEFATPTRRGSLSPRREHEGLAGRAKSAISKFYLQRLKGFDVHQMCLSFIGYEGSEEHVNIQKDLVDEIVVPPWRDLRRDRPGRTLRPEEVRYTLPPGLPARSRRARGRFGDIRSVVSTGSSLRRRDGQSQQGFRTNRREGLHHVPPRALLSLGRVSLFHVCVPAIG